MPNEKHIDIVVPCYNEQECVDLFYDEVIKTLDSIKGYKYTIIFIDDGSSDNTLIHIQRLEQRFGSSLIKYISFARNFGKESAIYAGLKVSTGDLVALMDCDLQDPPSLLPNMINAINEGYDCCATRRITRTGEPVIRSFFANQFYNLINKISDVKIESGARDFRLMTRQVVNAVLMLSETERFSKGLFSWVGFKTKWIEYQNTERVAGITKWSFIKLLWYAISGIVAFSIAPLRISSFTGIVTVCASFIYAGYIFIKTVIWGNVTSGFSTLAILILFLSGIIIILLGIIGEYLARLYKEVKHRPIYLVKNTNIDEGGVYYE